MDGATINRNLLKSQLVLRGMDSKDLADAQLLERLIAEKET